MCWRDDVPRRIICSLCGNRYSGDLGHRDCPALKKEDDPKEKTIILPKDFLKEFEEEN